MNKKMSPITISFLPPLRAVCSYFRQAAHSAINIFLALHDGSIELSGSDFPTSGEVPGNVKGKKKAGGNAKQSQQQQQQQKAHMHTKQQAVAELLSKHKPLSVVEKIVGQLLSCCSTDELTSVAHYNLAFRKGKNDVLYYVYYCTQGSSLTISI